MNSSWLATINSDRLWRGEPFHHPCYYEMRKWVYSPFGCQIGGCIIDRTCRWDFVAEGVTMGCDSIRLFELGPLIHKLRRIGLNWSVARIKSSPCRIAWKRCRKLCAVFDDDAMKIDFYQTEAEMQKTPTDSEPGQSTEVGEVLVSRRHTAVFSTASTGAESGLISRKERKAARQLGVIVCAFIVCWLPYFIVFLVVAVCPNCIDGTLYNVTLWLGYFNSTLNPVLYSVRPHFFYHGLPPQNKQKKTCYKTMQQWPLLSTS